MLNFQRQDMHASVIDLYDQLTNAPDERARARILAQAFEALETRYPHIQELATRTHVSETELRLIKEIEVVRANLSSDIERSRSNILLWSFGFWITQLAVLLSLLWRLWPMN